MASEHQEKNKQPASVDSQQSEFVEKSESVEQQIQQAADKLHIKVEWTRGITPEDLLYLLDQCPFLQIIDTAPVIKSEPEPLQLITARSGWTIHNYGEAMSSSPGQLLFGGYYRVNKDEDDEGGGGYLHGIGTVHGQSYLTAVEMMELAQQNGWRGIRVVDGHPKMIRAAWLKAGELGMSIEGFTPTLEDEHVKTLVSMPANDFEILRKTVSATREAEVQRKQPSEPSL